jgi:hypothetical protein
MKRESEGLAGLEDTADNTGELAHTLIEANEAFLQPIG